MRDEKGRFTKAAPRPFKVGDRVRITWAHTAEYGHFEVGEECEIFAPCHMGTQGCWMARFKDGREKHLQPGFSRIELVETAPNPSLTAAIREREMLAQIRSATGIHASDQPDLVQAVRSIATQMDRHRRERDEALEEVECLKAELEEARETAAVAIRERNGYRESFNEAIRQRDRNDGEALKAIARAECAEAKLADLKAALRMHALDLMDSASFKSAIEHILEA